MNFLYELIHSHPLISFAQTLFMVGMAVDAYRRRAEFFWYWVIFFVPIVGAWVYFFAVLAPHLGASGNAGWFQRKVSLEELRYRAEQTPTLAHNLALGQALIAKGAYAEAIPILEAAHKVEPEHGSVLFALAKCHAGVNQADHAAAFLERIIKRDPRWSDYDAWRLLIEIHRDAGHHEAAVDKERELVKFAPSLRHKCILGEILIDEGNKGEARALLEQAVADHTYTPATLRRPNRAWAKRAGKLLKRIGR
jgi:hypothetical protein